MSLNTNDAVSTAGKDFLVVAYVMFLLTPFVNFLAVVGVVLAYMNLDKADWLRSHAVFLIRTFWISFVVLAATAAFAFIWMFGFFADVALNERFEDNPVPFLFELFTHIGPLLAIGILWMVWVLIRTVMGLTRIVQNQALTNPRSWFFG